MIEKNCTSCAYANETDTGEHCRVCRWNYTDQFQVLTNADRIRNMTDEELAEELIKYYIYDDGKHCKNLKECVDMLNKGEEIPMEKCRMCLVDWLRESDG